MRTTTTKVSPNKMTKHSVHKKTKRGGSRPGSGRPSNKMREERAAQEEAFRQARADQQARAAEVTAVAEATASETRVKISSLIIE